MARDRFHDAVRNALEKDGWTITHDPLSLFFPKISFMLDLAADRVLALEKDNQYIAVEIKTFERVSTTSEFHSALGQYFNYRLALQIRDPKRQLFLAIPQRIHRTFFQIEFIQLALKAANVALLVYDPENEVITTWEQF
jgi:XisH protein